MFTVFKHTLGRSRGAILGWGLTLALLGMLFVPFFDTIAEDIAGWEELMSLYPEEILAFFGEVTSFTTPEGFLSLEYFSFMPLVLGVYAVLAGSGMITNDEESGVLDLIAAQPMSRSALFWGRLLAFMVTVAIILALGWAGIMFATTYSLAELNAGEVAVGFVSLGAVMIFIFGLALMFSMMLPSRRSAAMSAGILLVASFFLTGLAGLNDTLEQAAKFSPLNYYQGGNWYEGFQGDWFLILAGLGTLFVFIAWWRFLGRDIRVGGEGGFKLKLPKMLQLGRRKSTA